MIVKNQLSDRCKVKMEQLSKPKFKIVNIDNAANMDEAEMERHYTTKH